MNKFFRLLALAVGAVFWGSDRASAQPETGPTLEVRVRSVHDLAGKLEYLGGIVNQAEPARQLAALVMGLSDEKKGLEGIDPTRPLGLYASLTPNVVDSPVVMMVPVADEAAVLSLLTDKLNLTPKKGEGGLYEVSVPNVPTPVYFRFANGYAYLTVLSPKNLEGKALLAPKAFFAQPIDGVASAQLHLDRLPAEVKKTFLGQFELKIADAKERTDPGETPAQKQLRAWALDQLLAVVHAVLTDGKDASWRVVVDGATDELATEFTFTARSGSPLAKWLQRLGSQTGMAAALAGDDPAIAAVGAKVALPMEARVALGPVIDALVKEALGKAKDFEKQALKLVTDAVVPTLKAGELDFGLVMTQPAGREKPTLIAALGVAEGKGIEKVIKQFAPFAPESVAKFEFDVRKVGRLAVHKVTLPNPELKEFFGTDTIWLGTSDELILVSIEEDGKSLDAAAERLAGKNLRVRPLSVEFGVARLLPLIEKQVTPDRLKALTQEAFPEGVKRNDTVRLTLEGGEALKLRFVIKGKVVRLAVLADAEKKK